MSEYSHRDNALQLLSRSNTVAECSAGFKPFDHVCASPGTSCQRSPAVPAPPSPPKTHKPCVECRAYITPRHLKLESTCIATMPVAPPPDAQIHHCPRHSDPSLSQTFRSICLPRPKRTDTLLWPAGVPLVCQMQSHVIAACCACATSAIRSYSSTTNRRAATFGLMRIRDSR
eukprot:5552598-Pleurochrysis_carterae.AAC.3